MTIKFFLTALMLCCTSLFCIGQNIGHINYGNLLEQLPEVRKADKILSNLQDSLAAIVQTKEADLQKRIQSEGAKYQAGEFTPVEAKNIENQFRQEQSAIQQEYQSNEEAVFQLREQYLLPILETVEQAIQAYAKANNYDFIFNESKGALMYDMPENDLTSRIAESIIKK